MKISQKLIVLGFFLLLIGPWTATLAAEAPLGNPGELVAQLQADLETARANQLDILAPIWFEKAEKSFAKAKKAFEKGKELSDISKYLAEARLNLSQAQEMAKIARTILGDTNKARQKAIASSQLM